VFGDVSEDTVVDSESLPDPAVVSVSEPLSLIEPTVGPGIVAEMPVALSVSVSDEPPLHP